MSEVDTSAAAVERMANRVFNWGKGNVSIEAPALMRALAAERDALRDKVEGLESELEESQEEFNAHQTRLSNEFEGECWVALRAALTKSGFDDWSDPDGVTAQYAGDHIIESLDNVDHELKALRAQLSQARDEALDEAAGWLECHTLHEPSPSYPANAGRYHAVLRKDDWGGLHIGQDYAAAIRALQSTTTKEEE